jgi:malonate transporter
MAHAMGRNANLAANIIAITTAGSLITYSLGISILYSLNFFS